MSYSTSPTIYSDEKLAWFYGVLALLLLLIFLITLKIIIRLKKIFAIRCIVFIFLSVVATPIASQVYSSISGRLLLSQADKIVNPNVTKIQGELREWELPYLIDFKLSNRNSNLYKTNKTYIYLTTTTNANITSYEVKRLIQLLSLENTIVNITREDDESLWKIELDPYEKIVTCMPSEICNNIN